MECVFTTAQVSMLANALEKRFKENPSLFTLTDSPRHTMLVKLSSNIKLYFSSGFKITTIRIESGADDHYSKIPNILFHPIQFFVYRRAVNKLWHIAEVLLHGDPEQGDMLLYDLFPEMLENNIKQN